MIKDKIFKKILHDLISCEINKLECIELILEGFSDFEKIHNNLKEGDEIIYNGNKGYLLKKGLKKSIIKYQMIGKISNNHTNPEIKVYNIEFYKTPDGYWD